MKSDKKSFNKDTSPEKLNPRKKHGGLRIRGNIKKSKSDKPLISVVTVVFNSEELIADTIESVINQSYENVEYIVIDGGSTDQTVSIIQSYEESIDYWVSESDRGIYDAMNKSAYLCHGEWINFMNAGDQFHDKNTLSSLKGDLNNNDVVYGATLLRKNGAHRLIKTKNLKSIKNGRLPFVHQSSLIRTETFRDYPFSDKYLINSDFDQFLTLYVSSASFFDCKRVISIYDGHGFSSNNKKNNKIEKLAILRRHKISLKHYRFYVFLSKIRSSFKIIAIPVIKKLKMKKLKAYL
jgi:glycosyltransferase involved in cell wall biosynthesis